MKTTNAFKFNTLSVAKSFLYRMIKYWNYSIIMGDDNLFWIVTNRIASRLIKQGYEIAL